MYESDRFNRKILENNHQTHAQRAKRKHGEISEGRRDGNVESDKGYQSRDRNYFEKNPVENLKLRSSIIKINLVEVLNRFKLAEERICGRAGGQTD